MATASAAVAAAAASITPRQPKRSASQRSGAPALTAPTMPVPSANPATSAKRDGWNQCVDSFIIATKATPTDAPIRSRPAPTSANASVPANSSAPAAAPAAPSVRMRRGP